MEHIRHKRYMGKVSVFKNNLRLFDSSFRFVYTNMHEKIKEEKMVETKWNALLVTNCLVYLSVCFIAEFTFECFCELNIYRDT